MVIYSKGYILIEGVLIMLFSKLFKRFSEVEPIVDPFIAKERENTLHEVKTNINYTLLNNKVIEKVNGLMITHKYNTNEEAQEYYHKMIS
jgi:hypothetical protein